MSSALIHRAHIGPRYCQYVVHSDVVYLAGQVSENNLEGGVHGQTSEVLENISRLLEEAGSDKTRILSCQIFLKEVDSIGEMNRAWDAWVAPGQAPPRATVEARLANPKHLIEVIVTAALQ